MYIYIYIYILCIYTAQAGSRRKSHKCAIFVKYIGYISVLCVIRSPEHICVHIRMYIYIYICIYIYKYIYIYTYIYIPTHTYIYRDIEI